jgi:hypothetical protein
MRLVVLESPYAGKNAHEIARNVRYLRACMHDCFKRGDVPFASHGLYTQPGVLRDEDPEERKLGIMGGLLWASHAEAAVVYKDLGLTSGMQIGMVRHKKEGRPVEERRLGPDWEKDFPGGLTPDEIAVFMDKGGNIDEIFANVAYFHLERMDDNWFWFSVAGHHFTVGLTTTGAVEVLYSADGTDDWDPESDGHEEMHVEITHEGETHKVRLCPFPECGSGKLEALGEGGYAQIRCANCGTTGPLMDGGVRYAVKAWNDIQRQIRWRVQK